MSALAALEAAYAAHLLTAPVWPTHGVRWPVPHADACDCGACDDYRAQMRAWAARERELADACTAAEARAESEAA